MTRGGPQPTRSEYVADSPFVRLLATQGRVKLLDVLLRRPASRLTAKELADAAGVSKSTVSRNKDELTEMGLVSTSVDDNGRTRYQLNQENSVTEVLIETHLELLEYTRDIVDSTTESVEQYLERVAESKELRRSGRHRRSARDLSAEEIEELKDTTERLVRP